DVDAASSLASCVLGDLFLKEYTIGFKELACALADVRAHVVKIAVDNQLALEAAELLKLVTDALDVGRLGRERPVIKRLSAGLCKHFGHQPNIAIEFLMEYR